MKVTFYGHSCFGIEFGNKRLLFDPFISPNPLASGIGIHEIEAEYILLTHGHGDHVYDAEEIGKRTGAMFISNYEIIQWYVEKGLSGHGMNLGGKYKFDFGTVKYVNAVHSSTLPDGSCGGNPGGFVLWNETMCFYIAGDTALTMDMKLIPRTCPPLDFAILPIGDNFTMDFHDAIEASDMIGCDRVIGCHYDTFPPIRIDKDSAKQAFEERGKELILMEIGEELSLNRRHG